MLKFSPKIRLGMLINIMLNIKKHVFRPKYAKNHCVIFEKKLQKNILIMSTGLGSASAHLVIVEKHVLREIWTKMCLKMLYFMEKKEKSAKRWGLRPLPPRWPLEATPKFLLSLLISITLIRPIVTYLCDG